MKRTKKLIALLLVCASICTLLPAVAQTANAITLTGTTTVTEDFSGATSLLNFDPSTELTGSISFKESGGDGGAGTKVTAVPGSYGLADGTYQIKGADGGGWIAMWTLNETGDALYYSKREPHKFQYPWTPYRFSAENVTGITSFSGRLYANFSGNDKIGIIYNYMDNGNYDILVPDVEGGRLYCRMYSIRTVVVGEGDLARKEIWGRNRLDQPSKATSLTPQSATVNGTSTTWLDFTVEYLESGLRFTFSDGTNSTSQEITDSYLHHTNFNLNGYYTSETRKIASFTNANTAPSKSTGVGFAAMAGNAYVDNLSLTYSYTKSAEDLGNEWKADHAVILAKDVNDITESDRDAINAAIADYNTLVAANANVADVLTAQRAKLGSFLAKLAGTAAEAYFVTYGDIFAPGFQADSAAKTVLLRKALVDYSAFTGEAKDAVDEKALTDYAVDSIPNKIAELTKAYYFSGNTLVYDDFNSYTSDEAYHQVWQDIPLKNSDTASRPTTGSSLILNADGTQSMKPGSGSNDCFTTVNPAYRGAGMLKQFKVVMNYDGSQEATNAWYNHFTFVPYKGLEDDNYIVLKTTHCSEISEWYNLTTTYTGHRVNGITDGTGYTINFGIPGSAAAKIAVTFDYKYVNNDEPSAPFGSTLYYSWVEVKVTAEATTAEGTNTKTSTIYILPGTAGGSLSDKFTAGIYTNNTIPATFESISYTYAKSADEISAEFEAYQDTYGMSTSAVTKDNLENINAALAVYNGLTELQKSAYLAEKANLDALQAVAQFHSDVEALTVTPATNYTALSAEYAALGVTNETVKAAVDAIAEALKTFEPTLYSATIKADANPVEQRLRFNVKFNTLTYEGFTVKEYGVVMLPNQMLGGAELKLETANAVKSTGISETLPEQFRGYLAGMGHDGGMCATRIAARAYVIYVVDEVEYVYYSTNTTEGYDAGVPTKGTSEGVAVRSVYSIAKAMATNLLANKDNYTLDYSTQTAITAATESIEGIASADVLAFVVANAAIVETIG